MIAVAEYDLSLQLFAGKVDKGAGIIYGATVGQSNVEATGKFVFLDKDGNLVRDPELAARKLQVVTDAETLATLMTAAAAAGGSTKSREDHDDSVGARLGFADNFKLVGNKVTCDIHVFDNYRNRDLFLETAAKTPKEIGLSIDMNPSFEIFRDRALMRIEELFAVDIVDEGAITHDGLFLNRGVDKTPKVKLAAEPKTTMADDKKEPTVSDCMTAISELAKNFAAYAAANPPKKVVDADDDGMSAVKTALTDLSMKLAATTEAIGEMKKTHAALGLKAGESKGGESADSTAEAERTRLAAEKAKGEKTYLQIVDEMKLARKADLDAGKIKPADIHSEAMRLHSEKYREHLKSKGVYDSSRDRMQLA